MYRWFTVFLALACTQPAQAQSLAEALEAAWSRHPQAATLGAREDEARARAELAAGFTPGPPVLSLSSLNDRLNRNRGKQEWEIEMAVPLWLPGQQAAREAEAERVAAELAARSKALRLQVAGEVREAWWQLAAARNTRELAQRRADTARALEADVLRRYKAGDLARIDANLAQGERLAAEAEVIEAEAALFAVEQSWRNLTGLAAPATLAAEGEAAARAEAAQADAELALARHKLRLDVDQARHDVTAAERQLGMARQRRAMAADNLQLAEKSFALGEADLTTLLRVRAAAFEAESFLNRQQVAYATALSRLKQALGVLP